MVEQRASSLSWLPTVPSGFGSPLRRAISELDARLSQRAKVETFSDDPRCLLRYAPSLATRSFRLSDDVWIAAGDFVIDIHCWNERIPPMPPGGADLAWAQAASRGLRQSLRLLAQAVEVQPALRDARACRARVNFVGLGGSNSSVSHIIHRLGFEDVDEGRPTALGRLHDAFENVLIGGLVWTHNPEALRRDKIIRERRPVWTSRARLLRMHGS